MIKGMRGRSLVFVDPGKKACALAHWKGGEFVTARLIDSTTPIRRDFAANVSYCLPDHMVIEIPQVYPKGAGKGEDPNDLIQVALSAGACASACTSVEYVYPGTWKGQVPKAIHHARIASAMTDAMRAAVARVPGNLQHNVLDAIALGMWWMAAHPT